MSNLRLFILACLPLLGCHDGLGIPDERGDGGAQTDASLAACNTIEDPSVCGARSDCKVVSCPQCGSVAYSCIGHDEPGPSCPPLPCLMSECSPLTDAASCDANPNCYSVYNDAGKCGCAIVGCCLRFDHCATGPAQCAPTGTLPCQTGTATPDCGLQHLPVYEGSCQIGCASTRVCQ
jgi:hypothetical protein